MKVKAQGLCPCVRLPGTPLTLPPGHTARYQLIWPHMPCSQLSRGGQEAEGRPEDGSRDPWSSGVRKSQGSSKRPSLGKHLSPAPHRVWCMGLLDQDLLSKGMPLIYPLIQSRGGRRESQWGVGGDICNTFNNKGFSKNINTHVHVHVHVHIHTQQNTIQNYLRRKKGGSWPVFTLVVQLCTRSPGEGQDHTAFPRSLRISVGKKKLLLSQLVHLWASTIKNRDFSSRSRALYRMVFIKILLL